MTKNVWPWYSVIPECEKDIIRSSSYRKRKWTSKQIFYLHFITFIDDVNVSQCQDCKVYAVKSYNNIAKTYNISHIRQKDISSIWERESWNWFQFIDKIHTQAIDGLSQLEFLFKSTDEEQMISKKDGKYEGSCFSLKLVII